MDEHSLPIDPDADGDTDVESDLGVSLDPAAPAPRLPFSTASRTPHGDVLVAIALGGMIGATARYAIARWHPVVAGRFPWATFVTNLSGSFLLGFVLMVLMQRRPASRYLRPFIGTGLIGAYTTMSTYEVETALLVRDHHAAVAAVYAIVSLVVGVMLAAAGMRAGRIASRAVLEAQS